MGQTMTDLGSLKIVNKKLDFEQNITKQNRIFEVKAGIDKVENQEQDCEKN